MAQKPSDKRPNLDLTHGLCVRRTLWEESVRQCHGRMKRYICNLALADLVNKLPRFINIHIFLITNPKPQEPHKGPLQKNPPNILFKIGSELKNGPLILF